MLIQSSKNFRPHILFATGNDPFSLGVKLLTTSSISHTAIVIDENTIIHAVTSRVKREPRSKLYTRHHFTDVAEFEVIPNVDVGLNYLNQQIGKAYDMDEIFSGLFLRCLQLVAPTAVTKNGYSTKNKWTCARLAMGLDPQRNRIPEWWKIDPDGVSPEDLFQASNNGTGNSFNRIK